MAVVFVGILVGGNDRVVWAAESCVNHKDDRFVGGVGVAGDSHYLICHLVHIDLIGKMYRYRNYSYIIMQSR